jgi:hypothetical protein
MPVRSTIRQPFPAQQSTAALPIKKLAAVYGLHPSTVWRAVQAGRLEYVVIGKRKLILPPVVQNVISRFVALAFMPIFFRFQRFVRFLDAMTRFLPWSINLSPSYLAPTRFGLRGWSANPRKNEETSLMFNNAKPNASRVRVLLDAPKPMMALNHWVVWRWSCRRQVNKPPVG